MIFLDFSKSCLKDLSFRPYIVLVCHLMSVWSLSLKCHFGQNRSFYTVLSTILIRIKIVKIVKMSKGVPFDFLSILGSKSGQTVSGTR